VNTSAATSSPLRRAVAGLKLGQFGPQLVLVAMLAIFLLLPPTQGREVGIFSFFNAFQSFAGLGLVALALGLTMIAREFDISCVAMYGLGSMLAVKTGVGSPLVGVLVAVGVGLLAGLIQGFFVSHFGINSMPVTLAGYLILLGITNIISETPVSYENFDVGEALDTRILEIFSIRSLIAIAVFVLVGLLLRYTSWGRDLRAIGGDRRAARTVGVRVKPLLTGAFMLSGAIAGLAGALVGYSMASASPEAGLAPLIFGATAALIGGVPLTGGRGTAFGIACGAISLAILQELFAVLASPTWVSDLITGALLTVAAIVAAPYTVSWWRSLRWKADADSGSSAAKSTSTA
jgi:ribose transport system permease protein